VSLMRLKLEFVSCVDIIEGNSWADMHNFLCSRRASSCVMFIFNRMSGRMNSAGFLSLINVNTHRYHNREDDFLRVDFHHTH
jgi:hypothetical protein